MDSTFDQQTSDKKTYPKKILNIFFGICFLLIFGYYAFSSPNNSKSVLIHIGPSSTITSVGQELETRLIVRHAYVLKMLVVLLGRDKSLPRGDYLFLPHTNVFSIAYDLARGHHNISPLRITIKEGSTNTEIANLLADKLAGFRKDIFIAETAHKQGQLFPDTYFFFSLDTIPEIVDMLSANFNKHIKPLVPDINKSGHTENEILTMASLIEKEAHGVDDAPTIAGILWKRIALDMPLQVDAYKSTYTTKGLPNAPIGNPGLVAIQASVNPVESPYLYYLHDKNGMVHYAVTYKEHQHNIAQYLK